MPVAISLLELDERLSVAGIGHVEAHLAPHAHDVVVLGGELIEQFKGTVAQLFRPLVTSVGEEKGDGRVDHQQLERLWGEAFRAACRRHSERVMRLPVGGDRCGEGCLQLVCGLAVEDPAESRAPFMVETGQLGDADIREVLRA